MKIFVGCSSSNDIPIQYREDCEILLNEGADINQVSKNGLNVLHFAAQGNQPKCLLYFVEKYKLDINSRDFDNNNILEIIW